MTLRSATSLVLALVLLTGASALGQQTEPAGSRLLDHALELLQEGKDAEALEELDLLTTRFPDSELVDDALVHMLRVRVRNGELEAATTLAERLESEHTDSPAVAVATVLVTDLRLRSGDAPGSELARLRDELARLLLLWPEGGDSAFDWQTGLHVVAGEISMELAELELARGWFAGALDGESAPAWRARGLVGLARCFLRQDEWRASLQLLQEAADASWSHRPPFPDPHRSADDLIALIYRHRVRPAIQSRSWREARRITSAGQPLDDPVGVAVSSDGQILLTDEGRSLIALLEADGTPSASQTLPARSHPWFDPRGGRYVTTGPGVVDPISRSRFRFERSGRDADRIEEIVAGARNAGGEWFLAHDDGDQVSRFSPSGVLSETLYRPRDGKVVDIALDSRGRLLILVDDADIVVRVARDGSSETVIDNAWDRPAAIATDGLDNIYVLDRERRRVHVFDPAGQRLDSIGPSLPDGGESLDDPRDIAVAPGGELLIIDRDLGALIVLQ